MKRPALAYGRFLDYPPMSPRPRDFDVHIGNTPGLFDSFAMQEVFVRIIQACQLDNEWLGLEYEGFVTAQLAQARQDKPGLTTVLRAHNARDLISITLCQLHNLGPIYLNGDSEPDNLIIQPLQALVELPALQAYLRRS